ncbi:unnamed protein product [Cochlearia groenlandica]
MAEQVYTVASDSENTGEEEKSSSSPSLPEIALGIDIGTSQCSIAVWNGSQVHILRNTRNQKLIKSFVTFKDDVPAGGVTNQLEHEHDMLTGAAIFNMKRLIGRVDTDPVVHASKSLPFLVQTLDIGVRPFIAALVNNAWRSTTPEEVLAIFLVELRLMAESQLKRAVRNVVLTVPVSFSRFQLTRIERACAMAGFHVLRLMPEPTAVALLYAQQQQQMSTHDNMGSGSERLAVIFNMGAGYCDVAITATAGGVSQVKALAGKPVGGEDILQNTMRHLSSEASSGAVRVATQEAIHRLSNQENVQIELDLGDGNKFSKVLDRSEFEEVNKDVFEECERLVSQCLRDARVEAGYIDDLIMVGGCSYIPKVREILKTVCKKDEVYKGVNPLEAAVRGAALEGAVTSGIHDPFGSLDLLTIQATALAVGVRANGNKFIPVIPRNTMVPARKDLFFTTVHDNQKEALIIVYEGGGDTVAVEENHLLGYFKIVGIPQSPKGVPEINVCMDIDASNALRVFAAVLMPGSKIPVVPVVEVRMPTVEDGHGWCAEALNVKYGSDLELVTIQRKK